MLLDTLSYISSMHEEQGLGHKLIVLKLLMLSLAMLAGNSRLLWLVRPDKQPIKLARDPGTCPRGLQGGLHQGKWCEVLARG